VLKQGSFVFNPARRRGCLGVLRIKSGEMQVASTQMQIGSREVNFLVFWPSLERAEGNNCNSR
jgi:hypothetical protein